MEQEEKVFTHSQVNKMLNISPKISSVLWHARNAEALLNDHGGGGYVEAETFYINLVYYMGFLEGKRFEVTPVEGDRCRCKLVVYSDTFFADQKIAEATKDQS